MKEVEGLASARSSTRQRGRNPLQHRSLFACPRTCRERTLSPGPERTERKPTFGFGRVVRSLRLSREERQVSTGRDGTSLVVQLTGSGEPSCSLAFVATSADGFEERREGEGPVWSAKPSQRPVWGKPPLPFSPSPPPPSPVVVLSLH